MTQPKQSPSMVRASVAEYLTFLTASGESGTQAIYADENVWLSQKMMGVLYKVETHTINYHIKKIFSDNELTEKAVIRNFRITADEGNFSAEIAHAHALSEFEQYRIIQDRLYQSDFDKQLAIGADNPSDEQSHQGDKHE